MSRWRLQKDGSMVAPKRGNPPQEPPKGYVFDSQDHWHAIPMDVPDCRYRAYVKVKVPCCGMINKLGCNFIGLPIGLGRCLNCNYSNLAKHKFNHVDPSTIVPDTSELHTEVEVPNEGNTDLIGW